MEQSVKSILDHLGDVGFFMVANELSFFRFGSVKKVNESQIKQGAVFSLSLCLTTPKSAVLAFSHSLRLEAVARPRGASVCTTTKMGLHD